MNDASIAKRIKTAAVAALQAVELLLPEWLPEGRRQGREWIAPNPVRGDRQAGSFGVSMVSGKWNDYADSSAHGGDLVSLLAYLRGIKQAAAARLIDQRLALGLFNDCTSASTARIEEAAASAARRQRQSDAEQRQQWQAAAQRARHEWKAAQPASANHPYLIAKAVPPLGLREIDGALLVPLFDGHERVNLQRIEADGSKRFLPGGRVRGCYATIGIFALRARLFVCEGWATGAALHIDTGDAVACAMNANNLMPVALALRERYGQSANLVIAGDDDRATPGNPGRTAARAAALAAGARLVFPEWPDAAPAIFSDFNDLHVWRQQQNEGAL